LPFPVASSLGIYPTLELKRPGLDPGFVGEQIVLGVPDLAIGSASADPGASFALADEALRDVRATDGFWMFFLNAAGNVVDRWLVGAGVFPLGA
jgi:hypothetical protein